jgi:hypothetical protein
MFIIELVGTTDQRHLLRALQLFYGFIGNLRVELILDDTPQVSVWMDRPKDPRVVGVTMVPLRPAA